MEHGENGRRRIAFSAVLAAALLVWLVAFLLPGGAKANWEKIFRFCGLGDYAAYADEAPLSVHILSVGKADSILVESKDGSMLIDGGTAASGGSVCAYLKKRGIRSLDFLVNTHPDSDHVGGLESVVRSFPVRRCLCPSLPKDLIPNTQEYTGFQSALQESGISAEHPKAGSVSRMGSLRVDVLGPVVPGKDANNNSIVLMLTFENTRFLLMGDAQAEEEASLLSSGRDLKADVLKVGHHGSSTSTTAAFLSAVRPRYAAISVGNDSAALPRLDVSSRLADIGAEVYRTDISGTVIFLSDGKSIRVITENS